MQRQNNEADIYKKKKTFQSIVVKKATLYKKIIPLISVVSTSF